MKKQLSDMALEELWQLFPIILTEHQDCWAQWYREEEQLLHDLLREIGIARISHIGSTAVQAIWAKPVIDILVEVPDGKGRDARAELVNSGYTLMSETESRISLNKGYTADGYAERVFHIHIRRCGDHDELYFRDYLLDHPEVALAYESLKLSLWKPYQHNRDAYTQHKTAFVQRHTEQAKELYRGRYDET